MNELLEPSDSSLAIYEHTVTTTVTVPLSASADQAAEDMEILDASLESAGWRGARPAWGATTIYTQPHRSA